MLTSTLLSVLGFAIAVYAQSSSTTAVPTPSPSIFANNSQEFYLRADLKQKDDSKAHFDGLYLYSYHTGAGLSDVTFSKNKTQYAAKGWINYTSEEVGQLTFNLGTAYPWTMSADQSSYRIWSPMYINVGEGGSTGFFLNETGLQWNNYYKPTLNSSLSSFSTWLICDWWHANSPQLFWRTDYGYNVPATCNCAEVYLCPEFI